MDGTLTEALRTATRLGLAFRDSLSERHVGARLSASELIARLPSSLPERGMDPAAVIEELAAAVEPGLVASLGPRYFGFVTGGQLPAATGADLLTTAWGQNAVVHGSSPAAAAVETVVGSWLLDALGLPADASVGLPTGAGLGNVVGLAAGRHALLERAGWDVESRGLYGAPEITVVVGAEAHVTLLTALQYLGLGRDRVIRVPTDSQGRMLAEDARAAIESVAGPLLVAIQAGNVNSGAFDPAGHIADATAGHPNAWMHVDGAFGLWAVASPRLRHLAAGVERADSWSTDAHKWLNSGYDCGIVVVRDPRAHRLAMSAHAPYLMPGAERDNWEYVLDSSRRGRGFILYAALRTLGREGIGALVEHCCALASQMATRLRTVEGVEVLNDVQLNQVLVAFGDDARTRDVISRVQDDGTVWAGGTIWRNRAAMRISVSNWSTTERDAERAVEAILRCARDPGRGAVV